MHVKRERERERTKRTKEQRTREKSFMKNVEHEAPNIKMLTNKKLSG
jgi:hypothetical protein